MRRYLFLLFFVLTLCFTSGVEARKLALLVGVNDYVNVRSLECCVNDIKVLKEALIKIGFEEDDIQMLVTGDESFRNLPTKKRIEQSISDILSQAQPTDIVFFAFSGHGAQEGKNVYFCPPDVETENLEGTCVSITRVMEDLSKCQAKFKWIVVDACRNDPTQDSKGIGGKGLQVVPTPPAGIALFQSCAQGEESWEDKTCGNGFFTKNFVAALSGEADANQDGKLTLLEVCYWTTAKTKEQVKNSQNKSQRPYFSGSVSDFILTEDLNVPKAKALVEEAQEAVKTKNYALAIQKYNEAIALCPRFESWKRERDLLQHFLDTRPTFNPMNVIVPDNFATIEEAYNNVKDGGIITIQPGKYELSETLVTDRSVTFRGSSGRAEDVVIDCPSSHAFQIVGGSPSFQNLTASSGADTCGGFSITGGSPKLFHCIATSRDGAGIYVKGEQANPQVESCILKDCKRAGVRVEESGLGVFKDCDFSGNGYAGIQVTTLGNPTLVCCKFHDGKQGGAFIFDNGLGTFNNCDFYGNSLNGIGVKQFGNPTFTGCRIHDGKAQGVTVYDNGLGKFTNCEIYGNEDSGIGVYTSGNPTFTRCKIHSGKAQGALIVDNGLGKFADCDIYRNAGSGIEVKAFGNPTVIKCKIHDGNAQGVYVHNQGMGTFNNNILEKNFLDGAPKDWHVNSDAGVVKGSENSPTLPIR